MYLCIVKNKQLQPYGNTVKPLNMMNLSNDNFQKTNKKVRVTFGGWDGKSYNGEAVNMTAFTNPDFPGKVFVRTRKSVHGEVTLVYHEVLNETHKVSGEKTVTVFTYFEF